MSPECECVPIIILTIAAVALVAHVGRVIWKNLDKSEIVIKGFSRSGCPAQGEILAPRISLIDAMAAESEAARIEGRPVDFLQFVEALVESNQHQQTERRFREALVIPAGANEGLRLLESDQRRLLGSRR
jgi:hypothetical protein